jgi:hypothetical protein
LNFTLRQLETFRSEDRDFDDLLCQFNFRNRGFCDVERSCLTLRQSKFLERDWKRSAARIRSMTSEYSPAGIPPSWRGSWSLMTEHDKSR